MGKEISATEPLLPPHSTTKEITMSLWLLPLYDELLFWMRTIRAGQIWVRGPGSLSWAKASNLQTSCFQPLCPRNRHSWAPRLHQLLISTSRGQFLCTSGSISLTLESTLQWIVAQNPITRILLGMKPVTLAGWPSSIIGGLSFFSSVLVSAATKSQRAETQ